MLRKLPLLACFFIWASGTAQQYPFAHYTQKDGLLSPQVRGIYQDSKGLLYFTTLKGLSVYDGARFTNYTSENGLQNDVVNCVMEMGEDSVWVISNINKIHCLVNGKLKTVALKEQVPIIDNLVRDEKGTLYAASEDGLYVLQQEKFVKLPFVDKDGRDASAYIDKIIPAGNYLLVLRDNTLVSTEQRFVLYVYDKETKKIITQSKKEKIFAAARAPDGRIWASAGKNILSIDTLELKKGKIVLSELPGISDKIKNSGFNSIFFDQEGNCWVTDRVSVLKKIAPDGTIISFTTGSGLSTADIDQVFQDKEGTIWIATFSAGVDKLVHSNFSFAAEPFDLPGLFNISYSADKNQLLLYNYNKRRVVEIEENKSLRYYDLKKSDEIGDLIETPSGLFGISAKAIYRMIASGNQLYPQTVFNDTIDNRLSSPIADKNGNLVVCGKYYLTAVIEGKTICRKKISFYTDQAALDTSGNIWIVTRDHDLSMFETKHGDPENYLEQKLSFKNELSDVLPRSLIIDRNDIFWIGSRTNGLFAFRLENGILTQRFHLNSASGLTDNFISYLNVDKDNNIWACSPSGLDRISIKDGIPVIENITKQNNIYQSVRKVVIDKNNTAWALLSNGLIKITPEKKMATGYAPKLTIASIKVGKDTMDEEAGASLSYKQNSPSFYFAAPTYLDEKQVLYSYQLQGSGNNEWTEPTNNASVSFIDLQPRDYILNVKVSFPSGRYPQQMIQYKFSILPPWWQSWWFRTFAGLLIIGLLIIIIRFYYRRKLEKEKAVLEKQQAIEKERTRIATDMHDDLGAGLSRIKFLSETIGIKKQQQLPIEEDISKIREYSHDMIDKMGEIVWALNEKNDSLSDLLSYTRAYAVEYLSQNGTRCIVEAPEQFPAGYISGEFRRNIYLTIKEALHNVVKHAQATVVIIKIEIDHNLVVEIKDNGTGFDKNTIRSFSNGLSNMKSRITGIGGGFEIINETGTLIKIKVPLYI